MLNSSIWPRDQALLVATTKPNPGSNDNEGVLHIPQSSSITEASLSDCLVSYSGYLWGEFYSSAEMQLVYSAAPADWAT